MTIGTVISDTEGYLRYAAAAAAEHCVVVRVTRARRRERLQREDE